MFFPNDKVRAAEECYFSFGHCMTCKTSIWKVFVGHGNFDVFFPLLTQSSLIFYCKLLLSENFKALKDCCFKL